LNSDPKEANKEVEICKKNANLLKGLSNKNIIKYVQIEISESSSQVDVALEYIPPGSIRDLLEKYGKFNEIMIKIAVRQIVDALNYIHSKGICHKNLKCSNLLVDYDLNIKLTDFGFLNNLPRDTKGMIMFKNSPCWTSPEVEIN